MTTTRTRRSRVLVAIAVVLAGAACESSEESGSATMRPGENCLSCHQFTLAGTVYDDALQGAANVDVAVTDNLGVVRHYTSNSVGNFYTTDAIAFPIDISVSRGAGTRSMPAPASSGACNGCHDASQRITVP